MNFQQQQRNSSHDDSEGDGDEGRGSRPAKAKRGIVASNEDSSEIFSLEFSSATCSDLSCSMNLEDVLNETANCSKAPSMPCRKLSVGTSAHSNSSNDNSYNRNTHGMEHSKEIPVNVPADKGGNDPALERLEEAQHEESKNWEGKKFENDYCSTVHGDEISQEDEDRSECSDSFKDDEASSVDVAHEREKQVQRSLCFAICSALGLVFLMSIIGKLIECFSRRNANDKDEAVAVVEGAVDDTMGATMQTGTGVASNPSAV